MVFALAALPSQPAVPTKDDSQSSFNSIMVQWASVADTQVVTSGYKLYMDGGNNGEYTMIYDGSNKPGLL